MEILNTRYSLIYIYKHGIIPNLKSIPAYESHITRTVITSQSLTSPSEFIILNEENSLNGKSLSSD